MSEFDEARLAAAAGGRAQMAGYGLSLDDLVAAGCFSGTSRAKRGRAAAADVADAVDAVDAPASSAASAGPPISATPAASSAASSTASPATTATASGTNASASPQPAGVLYRNALGQCWDGTGEMPDWLQRAVNAGQTPEFYRVS